MTSSARDSSDGGIVIPSAFAVLLFMTNSNRVACRNGKSVGRTIQDLCDLLGRVRINLDAVAP
jgi:hypothetical protein